MLSPAPPELSVAVPLKGLVGPVSAAKFVPSTGFATDAVTGAVLSTVTAALGPAAPATLPAASTAVPPAIEMLRVPSPVIVESVTLRVVAFVPTVTSAAAAFPVELIVISLTCKVIVPSE